MQPAAFATRLIRRERGLPPNLVTARALDLDHLRAEVREQLARV